MTVRRHPLRRCRSTNRRRPHNSPILKNSSIKCLTSLADLSVHLHEIIRDGTRLILDRIHLYVGCIIKATGFTGSQIRQTTSSLQPSCPSDCDDSHFILRDLASVGLCRRQVGRNFKSIILINPILLTHIEGNAVRGRRHRWNNQSKSQTTQKPSIHLNRDSPFVTRSLLVRWPRGKGFSLFLHHSKPLSLRFEQAGKMDCERSNSAAKRRETTEKHSAAGSGPALAISFCAVSFLS